MDELARPGDSLEFDSAPRLALVCYTMGHKRHSLWILARMVLVIAVSALLTLPAETPVCTLADHIRSANTNTSVGFCPAGTSHDIITITEDITLTEALPPITDTITIEGGGHTISGDGQFRIFDVSGGNLTLKDVTLAKASAPTTAVRSARETAPESPY